MRLAKVELVWFRGAAVKAELVLDGCSAVVFGTNGSGKSSFVDGVEVCMTGGKVGHLIHEYSGRYQDKGLINTRRPDGVSAKATVSLSDQTAASLEWVTHRKPCHLGEPGDAYVQRQRSRSSDDH